MYMYMSVNCTLTPLIKLLHIQTPQNTHQMLPPGFRLMPVSKSLMVITILCPLLVSIFDIKHWFILSYSPFMSEWSQFYRLLYYQLSFMNLSEVLVAVMLITNTLKNLERWYGSVKLLHIVLFMYFYNIVITAIIIFFGYNLLGINFFIPSGPLGIIFGLLLHSWETTPVTYHFKISNIYFTDKSFTLLLALQLFLSQFFYNFLPVIIGSSIGLLVLRDILPAKNVRLNILVKAFLFIRGMLSPKSNRSPLNQGGNTTVDNTENASLDDNDSNISTTGEGNDFDITENENGNLIRREDDDTPVRPLASQFFDVIRR